MARDVRNALVRKIAMIEAGNGEHAHRIQCQRHAHRGPTPADPQHAEAAEMQREEGHHAQPIDVRRIAGLLRHRAVVKPATEGASETRHGGAVLERVERSLITRCLATSAAALFESWLRHNPDDRANSTMLEYSASGMLGVRAMIHT